MTLKSQTPDLTITRDSLDDAKAELKASKPNLIER